MFIIAEDKKTTQGASWNKLWFIHTKEHNAIGQKEQEIVLQIDMGRSPGYIMRGKEQGMEQCVKISSRFAKVKEFEKEPLEGKTRNLKQKKLPRGDKEQ